VLRLTEKMKNSRRARHTNWRDGFLFVGNHLFLDFLNTHPVQNAEARELLSDFSALLRWFIAAGLLSSRQMTTLQQWDGSARAGRFLKAVREFREELRNDIVAWERAGRVRGRTIGDLNGLMANHPMLVRLKENGSSTLAMESWFEARQPEDLFAPLAHSAAMLFASMDRSRIRQCGNCVLHFYDTSKKGTRRWCSMQLCGNKLKVAAYATRRRTEAKA
jgi:predicted RNA-binding Zn ribbon-like protein